MTGLNNLTCICSVAGDRLVVSASLETGSAPPPLTSLSHTVYRSNKILYSSIGRFDECYDDGGLENLVHLRQFRVWMSNPRVLF